METLATQLSQLNEQVHAALNDFLVARRLTHINQQEIRDSLEREPVDKWAYLNIMLQLRANDNRFSIEVTVSLAPPS